MVEKPKIVFNSVLAVEEGKAAVIDDGPVLAKFIKVGVRLYSGSKILIKVCIYLRVCIL